MYLVGDDFHAVLHADVVHALQFLLLPYSSGRVVRVAEDEGGGLLVGALALEILEVDLISAVAHTSQLVFHHFASIVLDAGEETVIHWCLNQYLLARHGDRLQRARERRNDS